MLVPQADLLRWLDYEPPQRVIDLDAMAERFWSKVDRNGPVPKDQPELGPCWLWTASVNEAGYGRFAVVPGVILIATRVAWVLQYGPIEPGMWALHSCDTPACVRHLFLGTHHDNVADMVSKGRHKVPKNMPKGDGHPRAKYSADVVARIFELREDGLTQHQIADAMNLSQSHVGKTLRGVHRVPRRVLN